MSVSIAIEFKTLAGLAGYYRENGKGLGAHITPHLPELIVTVVDESRFDDVAQRAARHDGWARKLPQKHALTA
jgi:hypothetical protein